MTDFFVPSILDYIGTIIFAIPIFLLVVALKRFNKYERNLSNLWIIPIYLLPVIGPASFLLYARNLSYPMLENTNSDNHGFSKIVINWIMIFAAWFMLAGFMIGFMSLVGLGSAATIYTPIWLSLAFILMGTLIGGLLGSCVALTKNLISQRRTLLASRTN